MKKIISIVIVIVIVVAAGMFLKKQKDDVASLEIPKIYTHSVSVVTAKRETVAQKRRFLAEVQASNSAYIASKFSANIKKIYVNENDKVKKNQLLIALDDSDIKANLASLYEQQSALKTDVANAKNILNRNKKLFEIEAISQESFDNSNVMYQNKFSALQSINERINQTKSQLRYLNIRAPFNGRVGSIIGNDGSLALPGKALLTLNSDDQKLVFSFVDREKPIIEGQKVYIGEHAIGEILKRYDDAKNALLVAEVKPYKSLSYANKSYKTIDIVVDSIEGCTLPINAVVHKKSGDYIVVYKDGKFENRAVEILLNNSKKVVLSECVSEPVAIASEAKLSLLSSYGNVIINKGN